MLFSAILPIMQVEVKLAALQVKYEDMKRRVHELEGRRGEPVADQAGGGAERVPAKPEESRLAASGDVSSPEPSREARRLTHGTVRAEAATPVRGSRTSGGAPGPAPWPLHPAVVASVSSSFQVFENPGYSPSSSGGGGSQRRRSSSGFPRVAAPLPMPVLPSAVGPALPSPRPAPVLSLPPRISISGDSSGCSSRASCAFPCHRVS
jgi:hypothetical protein